MKAFRNSLSIFLALLLVLALPVQVFAETYDIADGDVNITADESGQYSDRTTGGSDTREKSDKGYKETSNTVITGSSSGNNANTVTIESKGDATANVTFENVSISSTGDPTASGEAAVTVSGNAEITLKGENTVTSGNDHAGVEVESGSSLTISGGEADSLTAQGGYSGAGIGGGEKGNSGTVTVESGQVTATGGKGGAGIGGGYGGAGGTVTVENGTVTATGGMYAAGIGGGQYGTGGTVTVEDGTVTANGGHLGAGIGSGGMTLQGDGGTVTVEGGQVTATGGRYGAGIGGGHDSNGGEVTVEDGTVIAQGGLNGAGIGGGQYGTGGTVTVKGGKVEATGGRYGAGIGGGGEGGDGGEVMVENGTVTATGGDNGAGIGGGNRGDGGTVTVENGTVTATGGSSESSESRPKGMSNGAGIGGGGIEAVYNQVAGLTGSTSGGTITINGGVVNAKAGDMLPGYLGVSSADIGGGGGLTQGESTVTITGGTVTTSAGVIFPKPESEPTPKPAPESAQEASASQAAPAEYQGEECLFWDTANWQISQAEEGNTFTVEAGHRTWIPTYVVKTARSRNITLVIKWDGGEDITIAPDAQLDLSQWCIYLKDL